MSPHDGAGGGVGDSIKVWSEAAHMAASLTLLQITRGVDLMHAQSKALPRTRGDSSRTGPDRLIRRCLLTRA